MRTESESVLLRACGYQDSFLAFAEIGDSRFAEQAEGNRASPGGEFALDSGIAYYRDSCIESAFPAGLGGVSNEEALGGEPGRNEHGLRNALKVGPARGDADEIARVSGHVALEVGLQLRRDWMDLKRDEFLCP